ncbi:SAM-dependent methyltransferase [Kribbella sp. DT2]|uniref:SAM-dependent methyltransferase n=1 Tax=Kribbella sp. DT2 TaxID=3393427 RepID=UPI003CF7E0C7
MASEPRPELQTALRAAGVRIEFPSMARLWDYAGGGKDNFQADRDLYAEIAEVTALFPDLVVTNSRFVRGAATFLAAELGITQYIDLGVGMPTPRNLHNIVQPLSSRTKVVYVDQDPIVLAHARGLLGRSDGVLVVAGNVFDPVELLEQPELATFLDWDQPIAVFCTAVLHYHPGSASDVAATMQTYVDALPAGSCTVITHFLEPDKAEERGTVRQIEKVLTASPIAAGWVRTQDDIETMFPGQTLLQAGVHPCHEWWPGLEPKLAHTWIQDCIVGGIGQKSPA